MSKEIFYISGKIGDLPVEVFTSNFNKAKAMLIDNGFYAVSPIDLPHNHDKSWERYMMEDLEALINCDSIYMLKDWVESPGAKIEHAFAKRMGKRIIYE